MKPLVLDYHSPTILKLEDRDAFRPKFITKFHSFKTPKSHDSQSIWTPQSKSRDNSKGFVKNLEDIYSKPGSRAQSPNFDIYQGKSLNSIPSTTIRRTPETALSNVNDKDKVDTFHTFRDIVNSKIINQQSLLDRSKELSNWRKKQEDIKRLDKSKPEIKSGRSSPKLSVDKTLTRFIDQLILTGTLPLEAAGYFSPDSSTSRKEQRFSHFNNNFVKKKSASARQSPRNSKEERASTPGMDIIPAWIKSSPRFTKLTIMKKKSSQNLMYKILCRNPKERDLAQTTMISKWLSGIDFFSKLAHDKIVELGKILEPIYLEEGEVLCNIGDTAECAYIVYEGQLDLFTKQNDVERWSDKGMPGDVLEKFALEQEGFRNFKIQATKPTYVVALARNKFQNLVEETKTINNPAVYEIICSHDFLRTLPEVKRHQLAHNLTQQKFLKNEIIYQVNSISDRMYIVISGKVARRVTVTMEKSNKWPTGVRDWRLCQIVKTYSIILPIQIGEIFGVSEMIEITKRKEQVFVEENAELLVLTRDMFYEIFDEDDIYRFREKVKEDNLIKEMKVKKMFEQQENLQKIKAVALSDAFNFNLNNKPKIGLREISEKTAKWKEIQKNLVRAKSRDKIVISVQEVVKDLHSVYET